MFQYFYHLDVQKLLIGHLFFNKYMLILGLMMDVDIPNQILVYCIVLGARLQFIIRVMIDKVFGEKKENKKVKRGRIRLI